jgi:hypothetical protein
MTGDVDPGVYRYRITDERVAPVGTIVTAPLFFKALADSGLYEQAQSTIHIVDPIISGDLADGKGRVTLAERADDWQPEPATPSPAVGQRFRHPGWRGVWTVQTVGRKYVTLRSNLPGSLPTRVELAQWPGGWVRA